MVAPEESVDSNDSDVICEEDLIVLDEIGVGPPPKRKKKKKKKNKKPTADVNSTPDFIVLDSTGFSPQQSDKEEIILDSTNEDAPGCSTHDEIDNSVEIITPVRRKNSLLALFETPQNVNCDDLFQIDTTPSTKDFVAVPKYRSKFEADEVITGEEKPVEEKPKGRGGPMCWNCGTSGHQIRDCKQRRNPAMINQFRMEMQAKKAFRLSQTRYHEDEGTMYGTPIPGMPSQKLREAMGLEDNQLPEYIYRMRVLGYPPGWLEEAKVRHSGINLLDSTGQPISDPNDEDGEIVGQGERDQFDLNKLVEFPGFNVPPPKDILDESELYQVPPMQDAHSLENLIARLKPKAVTAYRKRKEAMQQLEKDAANGDDSDGDFMETEEIQDGEELPPDSCKFVPCPPPEEPPAPPPPPTDKSNKEAEPDDEEEGEVVEEQTEEVEEQKEEKAESSSRSQSPSLTQLEKYKNELLNQLNTTSATGAHRTPVASLGKVKSMEQGTPVLKLSPYQQLPSFDKFQKNVSDVINFENLPESTGKYENLSLVLNRVKKVMSNINP
ncbi:unnamed protein product [Bemisia tabaci]|uniref:CCHC-type domain-containing protein n=1 Tax=Bemisia tabaci TaxID=7038 RepID=A0A9P0AMC3_BEMTA|nr:unnamed protein product [Bemisia tabaci]